MRDMLDKLVTSSNNNHEGFSVFGIQTAGLTISLFTANRPSRYFTRLGQDQGTFSLK